MVRTRKDTAVRRLVATLSTSRSAIHQSLVAVSRGNLLAGIRNNTVTEQPDIDARSRSIEGHGAVGTRRGGTVTGCTTSLVHPSSFICLSTKASARTVVPFVGRARTIFIAGTVDRTGLLTRGNYHICLLKNRFGSRARTVIKRRTVRVLSGCGFAGKF